MPNSKRKGSQFEREVASLLSSWWTQDDPEPRSDVFWRTASSGGRATQRGKKGKATKNHHGDISATDPIGQTFLDVVVIELKIGYAKSTIADILDAPEGAATQQYEQWIKGLQATLPLSGALYWMLISQRTRRDAVAYFPEEFWDALWRAGADISPAASFFMEVCGEKVVACKFKTFLACVNRHSIEAIAKKRKK